MKTLEAKTKKEKNLEQSLKDKAQVILMQKGIRAEKQSAFNQLYKRYKASIFFVALKAFNNEETAKDITQEIFAKVFSKIDQYNFSTVFSTWLYNIANNHIIDYKRREKYEVLSIETLKSEFGSDDDVAEMSFQLEDKSEDNFRLLVRKERAEYVHLAIKKIKSEEGKAIINMIFIEGLPYEETAQQLNMPLGTIKAIMHRTKNEMKGYLANFSKY